MQPKAAKLLTDAGVKVSFESGADYTNLLSNLRKTVTAGMTREQALRAFTWQPAELFGVSDRLGSIGGRKIANLTISKGDLFDADVHVTQLFIDGRPVTVTPPAPTGNAAGGRGNRPGADASGAWSMAVTIDHKITASRYTSTRAKERSTAWSKAISDRRTSSMARSTPTVRSTSPPRSRCTGPMNSNSTAPSTRPAFTARSTPKNMPARLPAHTPTDAMRTTMKTTVVMAALVMTGTTLSAQQPAKTPAKTSSAAAKAPAPAPAEYVAPKAPVAGRC